MGPGTISFMFDDGKLSTYTNVFPLLRHCGFKGQIAVVTDTVGGEDQYTWNQIEVLAAHGWEIVSHSRTHDFTVLDDARMRAEIVEARAILNARGYPARVFNMPGGPWSGQARFATGSAFDALVRSTYDAYVPDSAPHPMALPADRYAIGHACGECYGQVQYERPLAELLATADRCAAEGSWGQFLWHDVKGPYLEKFKTVVLHVERAVRAGRLAVATIPEVLGLASP